MNENGNGETKVSEAVVTLLMPIAMRERLQALADANERSMSAEARWPFVPTWAFRRRKRA